MRTNLIDITAFESALSDYEKPMHHVSVFGLGHPRECPDHGLPMAVMPGEWCPECSCRFHEARYAILDSAPTLLADLKAARDRIAKANELLGNSAGFRSSELGKALLEALNGTD